MARAGVSHITKCTSKNFTGSIPVTGITTFQAKSIFVKNVART